jgi:hypothetical protein
MVIAGWVARYAITAEYRVMITFTDEGLRALEPVRGALHRIGDLSDIEMSALAWTITTQLGKPWSETAS